MRPPRPAYAHIWSTLKRRAQPTPESPFILRAPEGVAQSVEQRTFNPLAAGSSPAALTIIFLYQA
jgi:hypothetical protein